MGQGESYVRSHAKASSAGSNSDRGKSHRSLRRSGALAGLLVALMAAACLLPGSAFAIEFRTKTSAFGPDGTSGTSFGWPTALAFDQSSKRLYGIDQHAHAIDGFDASTPGSHPPLAGFPIGPATVNYFDDLAADSASHDIYLANDSGGKLFGFDDTGAALAGFPVASEYVCGVAVDTSGNVWAATAFEGKVREYSPAGVLLNTYSAGVHACRIALDSEDNLYVAENYGATKELTKASGYTAGGTIDHEETWALTVDRSTDELFVVHEASVSVYDTITGALLYEFAGGGGGEYYGELGGIAVDEATEEVFLSDSLTLKIDVFGPPLSVPKLSTEGAGGIAATGATVHGTVNPKGQAVEDCHFEVVPAKQFIETKYDNVTGAEKYPCVPAAASIPADSNPHAVSAAVTGLEPATVYHYRLLAKNSIGEGKGGDRQFTSGAGTPLIEAESVEAVGDSGATLAAKINPRGGQTTYHLEYGTTNAYGKSTDESAAFGFPADNSKHPVSVHVGGLEAGTAYHFRFVATDEAGITDGADTSFATYPVGQPFAPCPNDGFRTGAGSRLPDCRAYEQGTPVEKHGANAQLLPGAASPSGDRFTFFSNGGLPTSGSSATLSPYLATRGPDGWSTDGFLPLTEPGIEAQIIGANEDLSAALVSVGEGAGRQVFLRDSATASFQPPLAAPGFDVLNVQGFAGDPSHLILSTEDQLLPEAAPFTYNLYDLDHGTLTFADRVPAGAATSCDDEGGPACVLAPGGSSSARISNGLTSYISEDGSRVFFMAKPSGSSYIEGRVYMREDGTRTTWISASQRTTPDPGGEKPAELVGITPDGSQAFFLSCEKLTDDSTAVSNGANSCASNFFEPVQGQDLYSYDVGSGELTDLTVDSNAGDPLGATVRTVLGTSEDGSYLYFIADGVLAPGASPKDNLYVYHDGATAFIAKLPPSEISNGALTGRSRVSENGHAIIFSSRKSLTGYDNVGPCLNGGAIGNCQEFFRYSAPEEKLVCVSCNPTGVSPSGDTRLEATAISFNTNIPFFARRNLSADGNRFFFDSPEALVAGDTNHVEDVYEWEAKGEGSCESESQDGGCLYLISGGTNPELSQFLGASRNGDHVFFFTEQQLVPTDEDALFDVYDAGAGAGLASQHTLTPPTCSTTACQANPAPPPDPSLASAAYSGAGNVHPATKGRECPKGKHKVQRKGRTSCASRHAKRHNRRHHNRANAYRGGSK